MTSRKSLWRGVALFAGTCSLLVTAMTAAYSAPGAPGVPGGGGGGNKPPTETSNNLSVPTVFVPGTTGAPTLNYPCGASVAPTGETTYLEALEPTTNLPDGRVAGDYYLQGEDKWQAGCATADAGTVSATGDWGDNLEGDAALKVGSPVRVEILLTTATPPSGMDLTGYTVVKLTDQLDRDATYGTIGTPEQFATVGVWASDSKLTLDGPGTADQALVPMGAEVNATGKVVYGYNWRPSVAGTYTLTFEAPSVLTQPATITFDVAGSAGRGGGRGGGGGPKSR